MNAEWTVGSKPGRPLGVVLDCPTCIRHPHRLELPLHDVLRWSPRMLFKSCGDTLSELSLFPTIIGEMHHSGCTFKGWIKLGHVEHLDLESRAVRPRWENTEF